MDTDPEGDDRLPVDLQLDLDRALDRLHRAGEDAEGAVPVELEDLSAMPLDGGGDERPVKVPLGARHFLVGLHEGRVAHHVREHDGGQVACRLFSHGWRPPERSGTVSGKAPDPCGLVVFQQATGHGTPFGTGPLQPGHVHDVANLREAAPQQRQPKRCRSAQHQNDAALPASMPKPSRVKQNGLPAIRPPA